MLSGIRDTAQRMYLGNINEGLGYQHNQNSVVIVSTERKVEPEARDPHPEISASGDGVTNAIRAFINSDDLPRDQVTRHLLNDLNSIYEGDAEFGAIFCQENQEGIWEIFLRQNGSEDVRLSESGSSLQSVFIILSILRLRSVVETTHWKRLIFCIEEPENNMHPALLRRLLEFLATRREEFGFTLFLTTHSPVCIDWASRRDDVSLIHVTKDNEGAKALAAPADSDRRTILDDLDIRASDLLQANGIIWVEGPSDRIYLRRWIDLQSEGELKEGVHYSVMFYGGKLLSHLEANSNDASTGALISLIKLNRNIALLMDSDRHPGDTDRKPRMQINGTKKRIKEECESVNAFVWITEGREIENYLSVRLQQKLASQDGASVPIYEKLPQNSFFKSFKGDKISFAHAAADASLRADLNVLDLEDTISKLCTKIRIWNGLKQA